MTTEPSPRVRTAAERLADVQCEREDRLEQRILAAVDARIAEVLNAAAERACYDGERG